MPPLIEYTFEDMLNSNVKIIIKAYNLESAYETLVIITKHPSDFKVSY